MSETRWQRQKRLERWTGKRSTDLDTKELERAKIGGYEPGPDGYMTGRDPRRMSPDELGAMGQQRMSAQESLRANCLDCCAGSADEERLCPAITCPSWPFRIGKSPWRPKPSEERLAAMREGGRRAEVAVASRSITAVIPDDAVTAAGVRTGRRTGLN